MSILKYEYLKIRVRLLVLRILACLDLDELSLMTSSEQGSDLRIWIFCHLLPSQPSLRSDATDHIISYWDVGCYPSGKGSKIRNLSLVEHWDIMRPANLQTNGPSFHDAELLHIIR